MSVNFYFFLQTSLRVGYTVPYLTLAQKATYICIKEQYADRLYQPGRSSMMDSIVKIMVTVGILAVTLILQKALQKAIDKYAQKYSISHKRLLVLQKTKSIILYVVGAIALILTWGFSLENIWVSVAGFIGLVAIGFFAVWSILSNIFAGMMIYFSQTIRIQENIEIMPEGVGGTVQDINLFFIVLVDEQQNVISIPNNLVFQKMVKKLKT